MTEIISGRPPLRQYRADIDSSALPNGASTEAKQDTAISELQDIETDVESIDAKVSTEAKQDDIITKLADIETNQTDGSQKSQILFSDTGVITSFARLRVANPATIFDSKNIFDDSDLASDVENQPLLYDNQETAGSGTSTTYNTNQASTTLTVSANTAGTRVRQTRRRFNYLPGKSQLYLNSFVIGGLTSGVTKREGYFDENAGIFLEASDAYYVTIRTKTSGLVVDNAVARANWNLDTMDGNGASGINLDFTKTQIMVVDFEWLGVGRVRVGFIHNGLIYYAHQFLHDNVLSVVYTQNPNLPIRTEITNDGTGAEDSIIQICSTVISEGGQERTGIIRSASSNGTHVDMATENTIYAVLGIRLKSNYLGATIDALSIAMQLQTASHRVEWLLLFNPTVADTFTYADESLSAVQIARGAAANTVTGGYRIAGGYVETGTAAIGAAASTQSQIQTALTLGSLIDGTPDEIVLCARPIAGSTNVDAEGSMTWRELI